MATSRRAERVHRPRGRRRSTRARCSSFFARDAEGEREARLALQ